MPDRCPESKDCKVVKEKEKVGSHAVLAGGRNLLSIKLVQNVHLCLDRVRDSSPLEKTNSEVVCAACFETRDHRQTTLFSYIFVVNKCEHQFRVQVVASCNFLECKKGSIKAQMIYMN